MSRDRSQKEKHSELNVARILQKQEFGDVKWAKGVRKIKFCNQYEGVYSL